MLIIENCNSLSDLRQKLIDGEEVRTTVGKIEPVIRDNGIKDELKPCDDTISRQAAIVQLSHNKNGDDDCDVIIQKDIETIKALPPVTPQPKTGEWIGDAKTYYEELNKRGLGVDEYTPYFTDDIACSECLAKYSMLDNETQFFKYCPNCGCHMVDL